MRNSTKSLMGLLAVALIAATVTILGPQVGQGASSRVLSRTGDKLVGIPFTQEIPVTIPAGSLTATGTAFAVPANHILQVEFISVNVQAESSFNTYFALNATHDGNAHSHRVHMIKQAVVPGGEIFVAGQNVTIYADGGSSVNATIGRDGNNAAAATGTVTVTGRLFEN